jgi:hypothetical protein
MSCIDIICKFKRVSNRHWAHAVGLLLSRGGVCIMAQTSKEE